MSCCTAPCTAAKTAVPTPTYITTSLTAGEAANRNDVETKRYTPAATIVAACSSAETGVGPSIASGSQTCSGNCADLLATPQKSSAGKSQAYDCSGPRSSTCPIAARSKLWYCVQATSRPIRKPMSPSLVIQKAFVAARPAEGFSQ